MLILWAENITCHFKIFLCIHCYFLPVYVFVCAPMLWIYVCPNTQDRTVFCYCTTPTAQSSLSVNCRPSFLLSTFWDWRRAWLIVGFELQHCPYLLFNSFCSVALTSLWGLFKMYFSKSLLDFLFSCLLLVLSQRKYLSWFQLLKEDPSTW